MSPRRLFAHAAVVLILPACGGGGSSVDAPVVSFGIPHGINRFLVLPGSALPAGDYASAYYAAVDPYGERTTLDQFRTANAFGTAGGGAQERVVVYRNVRELGYGRRVTGRYLPGAAGIPERIVFVAENYQAGTDAGTRANVEAALVQDSRWHVGTSAIEWSCHPDDAADPACMRYAKYFSFAPDGQRQLEVDLDGQGAKAMPGPCVACHGGRADPLEADGSFPKVANMRPDRPGNVQGHLQAFQVDAYEWAASPGYSRADQERALKDLNTWVLCSYALPAGAPDAVGPNGCTRRAASANEWEGGAASWIENAYGGPGLPDVHFDDSRIPAGWSGQAELYRQVVKPFCRSCHILRGTRNQDSIDFSTASRFASHVERIRTHVFDRGSMPLALVAYNDFWSSSAPDRLAAYVDALTRPGTARDAQGRALRPGRPIADAGPALRMARAGADAPLSASDSLFAASYRWEVTGAPAGGDAVILNPASESAAFRATVPGRYTVRLTARNGVLSAVDTATVRVDGTFSDPSAIRFAHVLDVLRNDPHGGGTSCASAGCHAPAGPGGTGAPIVYAAVDRDASGGGEDATDLLWLTAQLRGRANPDETVASALLRKPAGHHHHGGGAIDLSGDPASDAALASHSKLYYWILNGMPPGGVAANPGASGPHSVRFTGAPAAAAIPLDGSRSVGATSYAWSIVSQPDAGGNPASLSNPGIAAPTLTVRVPGTYAVQLSVSDGAFTDSATRTIAVSERAFSDPFTLVPGSVDLLGSLNEMFDRARTAWLPDRTQSTSVMSESFDVLGSWRDIDTGTGASAIAPDADPDVNIGNVLRLATGAGLLSASGRQTAFAGVPATFGVMVIVKLNAVGTDPADALMVQQQTGQPHNANLQMRFADSRMELFYDGAWHTVIAHGGAYYTEWWVQCLYRGTGTAYDLEIYAGTEFVGAVSNVNLPAGPAGNAGLMVIQQFSGATVNRESRVAIAQVGADVRPDDLTLVSRPYSVTSSPTRGRLVLYDEDVSNAILPNTNLTAALSRDDGITWTPITLAHSGVLGPGEIDPSKSINILAGEADFLGPAGTALRYRVQSSGGKYHALQGVRMEWD